MKFQLLQNKYKVQVFVNAAQTQIGLLFEHPNLQE